jgi:hypothetical protein
LVSDSQKIKGDYFEFSRDEKKWGILDESPIFEFLMLTVVI